MDTSDYLFPGELKVTDVPLTKMLLVGSCLSEAYVTQLKEFDADLQIDYILFNNARKLPELNSDQLNAYQLQYIQIPLRVVLTDRVVRVFDLDRAGGFSSILDDARTILAAMLEAAMVYNKQAGILTLVANFFVPQGNVAPSLADQAGDADLSLLVVELNRTLAQLVRTYGNAYVADVEGLANSFGKRNFLDDPVSFYSHGAVLGSHPWLNFIDWSEHLNYPPWATSSLGRIESAPNLSGMYRLQSKSFYRLVLDQIRHLHRIALQADQVKVVIFDLDDTMWCGQIAEHYENGRAWPDIYTFPPGIWEAIQHLRRRGIAVAVCSKNDEALVRERWSRAVPLPWVSLDDFVVVKINWNRKSENVKAILAELNLTAKSAVFVDDNPVERAEVLANVPGVRAIGGNPFTTRRILLWSSETQRSRMSSESLNREDSYRSIVARNAEAASMDRETFLQGLQIRIDLDVVTDVDSPLLPRVLELANKTTQFNTTGLQWTMPELTALIANNGSVYAFSVQDKFSDYGLVGAVFVNNREADDLIVQYVMSCRVLGMDVEVDALQRVVRAARHRRPGRTIGGLVKMAEANTPCRDVFVRAGFQPTVKEGVFVIPRGVAE
ncbi:HAD-IIIC family phosphatase [Mycobacterium sp. M1]|uniref:HAD-IIIC family phosphatase n=1 Tax=Mycolicibacter acidiphilus TaxID=2835306 RepID=A0ABS5REW7_9MYCO|nr:HAD-IIIC family phosphatase [Mycolicibacter acidiphilus]MBS9532825.1 HAD-IIIC family phosphatase [Mycolicibacter acidiphilus]